MRKSPKTTWSGIFTLVMTGLSVTVMALKNPAGLLDPQVLTAALGGVSAGIGLITAKDESKETPAETPAK